MAEGGCEQQLHALFGAYAAGAGSLGGAALAELCAALPAGAALQRRLRPPVSFPAFRTALITLLAEHEHSDDSSGRELSPKFTVGTKRYGRRSRPSRLAGDNRLRRCISFPDRRRPDEDVADPGSKDDATCRSLDPDINLESVSYPDIQYESEDIQYKYAATGCVSSFNKLPLDSKIIPERHMLCDSTDKPLFDEMTKLLNLRLIAEMWESAGICRPYGLLEDLGFKDDNLKYVDLLNVLEEENRIAISNTVNLESNFPVTLLRAILCLYRWEISNVKMLLDQSAAERDKLKTDLSDANRRAVLLANDVDENHTKLEASTKSQIKNLEQKHGESVQRLTRQFNSEKELSATTISNLEEKLSTAQSEESKLKIRIDNLKTEIATSEKEKNELRERISEMTEINRRLTNDLKTLNAQKRDCSKCAESKDTAFLENKICGLQSDNTILRDKNDELTAELENVKIELCSLTENLKSVRKNAENEHDSSYIHRVKRRGVSPTPFVELLSDEESPRICKLRKCNDVPIVSTKANLPLTSSADKNLANKRLIKNNIWNKKLCDVFTTDRFDKLKTELKENSCNKLIDVISKSDDPYNYLFLYFIFHIVKEDFINIFDAKCGEFLDETIFDELKIWLNEMNCLNHEKIFDTIVNNNTDNDSDNEVKVSGDDDESKLDHLLITIDNLNKIIEKERTERDEECSKHREKCKEYESNIESLKNVYDECEEYWSLKFREEREIYDQEQQINDEKFADLMAKVTEYEEQYGSHNDSTSKQLPTIEEKFSLEKQYTDLEDEFTEYKSKMELELEAKVTEIEDLKNLSIVQPSINDTVDGDVSLHKNNFSDSEILIESNSFNDVNVKTERDTSNENNSQQMNNFDKPINGNIDDLGPISSPIDYLWSQKTISPPLSSNIQSNNDKVRDYHNPVFSKDQKCNSNIFIKTDTNKNDSYNNDSVKTSSSLSSPTFMNQDSNMYSKCFDTRIEGKILHCSELEETLQGRKKTVSNSNGEQHIKCSNETQSLNDFQENSAIRVAMLEIRCRQIQTAFRQYQMYSEAVMQQTLAAHRDEIGAMCQKLAAADLLVRDLYVENCHLTGSMINSPAL